MWIHTFQITFKTFLYRSGVYCAANACIEQVIQHGEVNLLIIICCLYLEISFAG